MTFQSSFLIRCRLVPRPDHQAPIINYAIQHVQTGAEFHAQGLEDILAWMTAQNTEFLSKAQEEGQNT